MFVEYAFPNLPAFVFASCRALALVRVEVGVKEGWSRQVGHLLAEEPLRAG